MYTILVINKNLYTYVLVPEQFAHQGPQGLNGEVLWHSFTDPDCQYQKSNNQSQVINKIQVHTFNSTTASGTVGKFCLNLGQSIAALNLSKEEN